MIWRPVNYDKLTQTQASEFNIVGGGTALFQRQLPLKVPKLETNEELVLTRAKIRPVVLLALPGSGILGKLARHHLVIPRYRAVKEGSGQSKLSPELINRIRTLEFPDVLFTPAHDPQLTKDGFLASHLLQPIPLSHLQAVDLALNMAFEGSRAKLRAKHHLEVLEQEIQTFLGANPYRVTAERQGSEPHSVVFLRDPPTFPSDDFALTIGDCVHALRCSLDYTLAVCRRVDGVASLADRTRELFRQCRLVFDDEYSHGDSVL